MSKVNDVVAEIKSILNSSKEQVTISSLGRDYELLIGTRIPFKEVGFQTLEDLLRDIPNLRLNQVGRDVYLDLRPDAKIAHITKLVQEQRSATKKKKKRFSSRFPPPRKSFHPSGRSNSAYSYNSRGFNSSSNYNTRNFNNSGDSNRQSHGGYRDRGRDFDKAAAADDSNRYRGSQRTDLDFSDNEIDYEPTGFTDEESSDETEPCSYPARTPEQAPAKQFEHLSVTVGNSTLGAGRGDRISRVSSSLCQRLHESNAKKNVDNVPPNKSVNSIMAFDEWDDTVQDTNNLEYVPAVAADDWDDSVDCDDSLHTTSHNGLADHNDCTRAAGCFVADASDWDDSITSSSVPCQSPVTNGLDEKEAPESEPEDQCREETPEAGANADSSSVNGSEDASIRPVPMTDSRNDLELARSPGDLQSLSKSTSRTLASEKVGNQLSPLLLKMRRAARKNGVRLVFDFQRAPSWGMLSAYLDHEIESW